MFKRFSPTSPEYKNELVRRLGRDVQNLTCVFERYIENEGHEYLDIHFKGNDFEAEGLVLVTNWAKIEGIRRTKGLGYSGAELRGLQIELQEQTSGTELVFKDLERIVD